MCLFFVLFLCVYSIFGTIEMYRGTGESSMLSPKTNLARKKCHESKTCVGISSMPNNVPLLELMGEEGEDLRSISLAFATRSARSPAFLVRP